MDFINNGTDANGVVLSVCSDSGVHLGIIHKETTVAFVFRPSTKYQSNKIFTSDQLRKIAFKLEMLNE